jgi:hypothetical protein
MSACIPGGVPLGKPGKQRAGTRRASRVSRRDTGRPERTSHDDAAGEGRAPYNATVARDRVAQVESIELGGLCEWGAFGRSPPDPAGSA